MYCGKLGIENYIPIHEFKAENLKNVILSKKNTLLNKNKYRNKHRSKNRNKYIFIFINGNDSFTDR